jgi:hypothetical protein
MLHYRVDETSVGVVVLEVRVHFLSRLIFLSFRVLCKHLQSRVVDALVGAVEHRDWADLLIAVHLLGRVGIQKVLVGQDSGLTDSGMALGCLR